MFVKKRIKCHFSMSVRVATKKKGETYSHEERVYR